MGKKMKKVKTIFSVFEEIRPEIDKIVKGVELDQKTWKIINRKIQLLYLKYKRIYPLLKDYYFAISFDAETNNVHVQVERRKDGDDKDTEVRKELDSMVSYITKVPNVKEVYDSSCEDCTSLFQVQKQLEGLGIKIDNYEVIDSEFASGIKLIEENDLNFLPSLLISKEIEKYWWVFDQMKRSLIEKDDYYVFKTPISPYKDISTGEVKGIVDITYLTDKSCEDCFDVTKLKGSFQSMGVYIDNEKYVDVSSSEGKNLLSKYSIIAVPTVILSEEISDYDSIVDVLKQVGTFEKDKVFIFRKLDSLNVKYKELR